ncbi:MAG: prephenate dehydrogenase/arogenate dehydrogenase family protein [Chloroflexi bacterium]|nr:prephenate dehydrogenase/arogenate dehydrogenase family protein [Chloroflexota bacterium]
MADTDVRRITIIGTGLIGGSLGLALKAAELSGIEIVGHDRDRGAANQAKKRGAIDKAEHNLPRAVKGASLVIIATPVLAVREVMEQIAPDLAVGAIVTDAASTKAEVLKWARDTLPDNVNFVGGHPMAGKETPGIQEASATLFQDKAYCLCPSIEASEAAVKTILGLVQSVGAQPIFIDAEEHDQYAAAISHLPLMLSTALFNLMRTSPSWEDMAQLASSGFKDTTRLASTDPTMSHDIWTTNRDAIIHWLERMEGELGRFRKLLEDANDTELLDTFARTKIERDSFLVEPPRRIESGAPNRNESRNIMMDMLVGGMMADRVRQAQETAESAAEPTRESRQREELSGKKQRRSTMGERIAEGVRRDLEKLEEKRAKDDPESGDKPKN